MYFFKHCPNFTHDFCKFFTADIVNRQGFFYGMKVFAKFFGCVPKLAKKPPAYRKNSAHSKIEENLQVNLHGDPEAKVFPSTL